jgi:hypothetical protein
MSGWDPVTGNPTEVKLRELGLDWAWEAMQNRQRLLPASLSSLLDEPRTFFYKH